MNADDDEGRRVPCPTSPLGINDVPLTPGIVKMMAKKRILKTMQPLLS